MYISCITLYIYINLYYLLFWYLVLCSYCSLCNITAVVCVCEGVSLLWCPTGRSGHPACRLGSVWSPIWQPLRLRGLWAANTMSTHVGSVGPVIPVPTCLLCYPRSTSHNCCNGPILATIYTLILISYILYNNIIQYCAKHVRVKTFCKAKMQKPFQK